MTLTKISSHKRTKVSSSDQWIDYCVLPNPNRRSTTFPPVEQNYLQTAATHKTGHLHYGASPNMTITVVSTKFTPVVGATTTLLSKRLHWACFMETLTYSKHITASQSVYLKNMFFRRLFDYSSRAARRYAPTEYWKEDLVQAFCHLICPTPRELYDRADNQHLLMSASPKWPR